MSHILANCLRKHLVPESDPSLPVLRLAHRVGFDLR